MPTSPQPGRPPTPAPRRGRGPIRRRVAAATLASFVLAAGAVTFAGTPVTRTDTSTTPATSSAAQTPTATAQTAEPVAAVSTSTS